MNSIFAHYTAKLHFVIFDQRRDLIHVNDIRVLYVSLDNVLFTGNTVLCTTWDRPYKAGGLLMLYLQTFTVIANIIFDIIFFLFFFVCYYFFFLTLLFFNMIFGVRIIIRMIFLDVKQQSRRRTWWFVRRCIRGPERGWEVDLVSRLSYSVEINITITTTLATMVTTTMQLAHYSGRLCTMRYFISCLIQCNRIQGRCIVARGQSTTLRGGNHTIVYITSGVKAEHAMLPFITAV